MCNERTAKMVPNILKRNSKVNRKVCSHLNETDKNSALANENNAQNSFISSSISENFSEENKCLKIKIKHKRLTNRRKQGFGLVNAWHELPNLNICSIVNDKKKMSNKNPSVKVDIGSNQRKLRHYTKKQDKQDEMSVHEIQQNQNQFQESHNISTDFISDCALSCLEGVESADLHNSIDFSSNEIFSQFNYEFYGDSNSNKLTENYDSMSSINESLMSSEHSNNDTSLLDDEQLNQSYDSCCNYCLDNCVSSWIVASETNNNTLQKDRMLTATYNQNEIYSNNNCNLNTDLCNTYLMDETLRENNNQRTTSSINYLDNTDQPLTELINYNNEYSVREEVFKETINFDQRQKCDILNDFDDVLFESDFDTSLLESESEGIDKYSVDILQAVKDFEYSLSNEKFQCSLCSLTFSNARTLAIHDAAAHGGTYVILCESCGRLFNRKYHFNRHFIHCGRFKEPYRCDMCIKVYRHKSSLVHHLRETHHVHYARHHKTKFTCSLCNKVYSKFGSFENHIKKHQNTSDKLLNYSEDLREGKRGRRLV